MKEWMRAQTPLKIAKTMKIQISHLLLAKKKKRLRPVKEESLKILMRKWLIRM